ncbi:MAG TPA: HU family DNA-binding protein [Candidatus Moranbacteria bacterium]|nr:HU family DNA-binding protein [Candidatus Moranbacteria bacterium]
MQNVNKAQLVAAIAEKTDLSKRDVEAVVDTFVDTVTAELQKGNKVTLTGFGVFKTSDRKAREGVNPKTGERISIPATTVPKFTAGKALKDAVK